MKKIESIVDSKGVVYTARDAINRFKPRTKIFHESRMGNKEFRCNLCGEPIIFSKNGNTGYIRHKGNSMCPWHSGVTLTKEQADALHYNGAKEGKKHILYKNLLFNFLKGSVDFTNEALETRRTIRVENMINWRQPDVFATYKKEINIAFEIQLQTILMTHIHGRRKFYERDDTFMMWIFDDRDIKDYRFSDGDIFFTNNQNGFFLNKEVLKLSRKNNKLIIGVKYHDFILDENNEIDLKRVSKIVSFDKITFNRETREVYYFDSRAKYLKLKEEAFINTPVDVNEIFEYNGIKFRLLKARNSSLYIHHLNKNNVWRAGKYHSFSKDFKELKRLIVLIS